jgi:hypothetical protein
MPPNNNGKISRLLDTVSVIAGSWQSEELATSTLTCYPGKATWIYSCFAVTSRSRGERCRVSDATRFVHLTAP